jgi:hypothetical protein
VAVRKVVIPPPSRDLKAVELNTDNDSGTHIRPGKSNFESLRMRNETKTEAPNPTIRWPGITEVVPIQPRRRMGHWPDFSNRRQRPLRLQERHRDCLVESTCSARPRDRCGAPNDRHCIALASNLASQWRNYLLGYWARGFLHIVLCAPRW